MKAVWDIPKGLEFLGISDENDVQFLNFGTDDGKSVSVDTVKWMAPSIQKIESQNVIPTTSSFRLHSLFRERADDGVNFIESTLHGDRITIIIRPYDGYYGEEHAMTFELRQTEN